MSATRAVVRASVSLLLGGFASLAAPASAEPVFNTGRSLGQGASEW
jgi:hypothetical protein